MIGGIVFCKHTYLVYKIFWNISCIYGNFVLDVISSPVRTRGIKTCRAWQVSYIKDNI